MESSIDLVFLVVQSKFIKEKYSLITLIMSTNNHERCSHEYYHKYPNHGMNFSHYFNMCFHTISLTIAWRETSIAFVRLMKTIIYNFGKLVCREIKVHDQAVRKKGIMVLRNLLVHVPADIHARAFAHVTFTTD